MVIPLHLLFPQARHFLLLSVCILSLQHCLGHETSFSKQQSLVIVRHGARWDYAHPEWLKTATRRGDPPLSPLGHQQARETGQFLEKLLSREGVQNIIWLSSPFLRCIQTSNEMLDQMIPQVMINPECSVWEIDLDGSNAPWCLPPLQERLCYFPRLNVAHNSLFIPKIPEHKSEFPARCDRAMQALMQRYPYVPRTAIVIVTHAAGCLCLTRAAAGVRLEDVNAAGPCGIYRLTRSSQEEPWRLDHWSKEGGLNGHMAHVSDMGQSTVPWHHMGPNGEYTGPKTSNRN